MDLFKKAKQRIFRGYFRLGAHIHVRHWRGHGIHSPFMYGIVRNVFMKSKITGPDTRLYDELRRERIGRDNRRKGTGKRRKGRLPDPAGTSPQRTQMAHGAADPHALPLRERRPAGHDDLLFQSQAATPALQNLKP